MYVAGCEGTFGVSAARRVVEIARDDRLLRADDHAGRLQADLGAMGTEMTLGGGVGIRIDVQRIVRAGLHARLAADTAVTVEVDDAIRALVQGHCRTDRHAGRVCTVVAAQDREVATGVGKLALLDVFHPGAKGPQRHIVLGLAGERAGMAADALAVIDDEAELGQDASPTGRVDTI
jgi:hypothetical protein